MAILSRAQIEKLAEIIRQHAAWFVWRTLGAKHITDTDLEDLKQSGILPMDVTASVIKYSFVLGKLEAVLKEAEWKKLGWADIIKIPEKALTEVENLQIEVAEMSAALHIRNLESDIRDGLYSSLAQATQKIITEAQVRGVVKDIVKVGIEAQQSYREVARNLREQTKETKRNWTRVAVTEMQTARQRGIASAIILKENIYRDSDGVDSNVTIILASDACSDCVRLYTDPKTGHPKIFKLSELMSNEGTQYIRPWRQNIKPVVPPAHVNCYCELAFAPSGWGRNKEGKMTLLDPTAYTRKVGK